MVDEGRVARLLRDVGARSARLAEAGGWPAEERGPLWLDGVKYLFVTTIEGCIDVAHHLAASEGWGAPDSNAAAVRLLGDHHVVEPELAVRLSRAVGFRNVLVHRYTAVDDDLVLQALGHLEDFDAFAAQVSAWMLGRRSGPGQAV